MAKCRAKKTYGFFFGPAGIGSLRALSDVVIRAVWARESRWTQAHVEVKD